MAEFVKAATVDQVPEGGMLKVDKNGKRVLIANIGGKFFAMDRICSHKGGPLDEGEFNDGIVTCPWHGAKFDVRSGKLKQGPAKTDLATYEIKVQGKNILVRF